MIAFHYFPHFYTAQSLQLKYVSVAEESRYKALKSVTQGGIVIVRDTKETTDEDLVPYAKGLLNYSSSTYLLSATTTAPLRVHFSGWQTRRKGDD